MAAAPAAWWTGPRERAGQAAYVHLIRADDDPVRAGAERAEGRGWNASGSRTRLHRFGSAYQAQRLRQHLADGLARTFNRLAVELYGVTADVAFGTPVDDALWALVSARELEHTAEAPVRFRLLVPYATVAGVLGLPINPARPRWCRPGAHDARCDRCRDRQVASHDETLCPHDGCHWSLQLCDSCGGFDESRALLAQHLRQCALALAAPQLHWDDAAGVFVGSAQLDLFGARRG